MGGRRSKLDRLHRANGRSFDHFGCHRFYHGKGGQVEHSFYPARLFKLQRLPASGQNGGPGFAGQRPAQGQLQSAVENRCILDGLNHKHLPFELQVGQGFSLKATDGNGLRAARWQELFKKTEIVAQQSVVRFQLLDLAYHFFLRSFFRSQQAA